MMAIYLFTVVALWAALTWALWKLWRRWRITEGGNRRLRDMVALVIGALWFGASFWYAGGQKYYYDAQVRRLCAQDGGIKVYEQVKLPAERFDKWGMVNFYRPTQRENALGLEYVFRQQTTYLRRGDPEMWRDHYQVVRRSNGRLLGEAISYSRRGGDLPGPWHPSSFGCPERAGDASLVRAIFVQAN
jgi:hypothetical protein